VIPSELVRPLCEGQSFNTNYWSLSWSFFACSALIVFRPILGLERWQLCLWNVVRNFQIIVARAGMGSGFFYKGLEI